MKHFLILLAIVPLVSCCGGNKPKAQQEVKNVDTVKAPEESSLAQALSSDTSTVRTKEQKENMVKIVKKYGEQWDFCHCVVVSDSINKAFKNKLTDQQMDALIGRFDFVDSKCKELTTFDNTTPEDRQKHEKKVRKCLKDAGVKV